MSDETPKTRMDYLSDVLNAQLKSDDDPVQAGLDAKAAFHDYVTLTTKDILAPIVDDDNDGDITPDIDDVDLDDHITPDIDDDDLGDINIDDHLDAGSTD